MSEAESAQPNQTNTPTPDNFITNLLNVFTSPTSLSKSLSLKPTIVLPLLLIVLSQAAAFAYYYGTVDYAWLIEDMVASLGDLDSAQIDDVRKTYSDMGAMGMGAASIVSASVFLPIILAIQAAYFTLVSSLSSKKISFRSSYSIAVWMSMPVLLSIFATFLTTALSATGALSLQELNSFSLNNLGFNAGDNGSLRSLFDSLSPLTIYTLVLMSIAYQHFTQSTFSKAAITVFMPYIIIFGGWAIYALNQ